LKGKRKIRKKDTCRVICCVTSELKGVKQTESEFGKKGGEIKGAVEGRRTPKKGMKKEAG